MSVTVVAACFVSFNMLCNGITINTPYQWQTESRIKATEDQRLLASHIYSRIWAAKGKPAPMPTSKLTCTNVWVTNECSGISASVNIESLQMDDVELGLITKIWGVFYGAGPPQTITIPSTMVPVGHDSNKIPGNPP